jgi:CheY-like chemotaxis protein
MPTALIVEDEPEANKLLAMLVQLRGYRTRSAFTGGEALESIRAERPDIVFLDLMLPDGNGYDICRALKTSRETSLIPVVMVTARLAQENREHSFELGASEFVPKPYTPDQIFEALATADAWKRDLEHHPDAGRIELGPDDGLALAREAGQLGSLLHARTPLAEADVAQIVEAVKALGLRAAAHARGRAVARAATVDYRLKTDQLSLTVRGEAGWLPGSEFSHGRFDGAAADLFDEVQRDESGRELVLRRRFAPPDATDQA